MTTETEPVMGPPCDVCGGQEPSIFSLMQFADYSQVKVGPGCAEAFLRDLADQIGQAAASAPAKDAQAVQDEWDARPCVCGHAYNEHVYRISGDFRECVGETGTESSCECGGFTSVGEAGDEL